MPSLINEFSNQFSHEKTKPVILRNDWTFCASLECRNGTGISSKYYHASL